LRRSDILSRQKTFFNFWLIVRTGALVFFMVLDVIEMSTGQHIVPGSGFNNGYTRGLLFAELIFGALIWWLISVKGTRAGAWLAYVTIFLDQAAIFLINLKTSEVCYP